MLSSEETRGWDPSISVSMSEGTPPDVKRSLLSVSWPDSRAREPLIVTCGVPLFTSLHRDLVLHSDHDAVKVVERHALQTQTGKNTKIAGVTHSRRAAQLWSRRPPISATCTILPRCWDRVVQRFSSVGGLRKPSTTACHRR